MRQIPKGMEHFSSGITYFPKGMSNIPNGTRHFPKGMDNIPNGTRHFLVEAKDISPVHCVEQCDVRCFLSNIDIN
ncbi:hypothetical protein ACILE2_04895 [Capnocytophaga canimorsus]|uniref:hypothetical protein n=1 Tax=Capnocytophaga canimorsus TaxID=28188 RepID=UPI0037D44592